MSENLQLNIFTLLFFLTVSFFIARWWPLHLARKRMMKTVRKVAEKERHKIDGQSVESWLITLGQNMEQPIFCVIETVILTYGGHDYFFVDGATAHTAGSIRPYDGNRRAFFLVAVRQSAVKFLSEQKHSFRLVTGSNELAIFSIFRWSDFTDALERESEVRPTGSCSFLEDR